MWRTDGRTDRHGDKKSRVHTTKNGRHWTVQHNNQREWQRKKCGIFPRIFRAGYWRFGGRLCDERQKYRISRETQTNGASDMCSSDVRKTSILSFFFSNLALYQSNKPCIKLWTYGLWTHVRQSGKRQTAKERENGWRGTIVRALHSWLKLNEIDAFTSWTKTSFPRAWMSKRGNKQTSQFLAVLNHCEPPRDYLSSYCFIRELLIKAGEWWSVTSTCARNSRTSRQHARVLKNRVKRYENVLGTHTREFFKRGILRHSKSAYAHAPFSSRCDRPLGTFLTLCLWGERWGEKWRTWQVFKIAPSQS